MARWFSQLLHATRESSKKCSIFAPLRTEKNAPFNGALKWSIHLIAPEFTFCSRTKSACTSCETVLVMKRDKNMTIPWQRGGDWKPILRLFFAPTPFAVCLLSSEGCFAPPCPLCRANFCFVVSSPEKLRQKGGPFWRAAISLSNPLAIRGSFHGFDYHQVASPAFLNRLSSRLDASPAATRRHAHFRAARARHGSGHLQSLISRLRRCWSHGSPNWLVLTISSAGRTAALSPSMCFRGSSCLAR